MDKGDLYPPYTVEDLQELTGAGQQVIRDAAASGQIPGSFKLGRRWLFARPRILQLLREGRPPSNSDAAD